MSSSLPGVAFGLARVAFSLARVMPLFGLAKLGALRRP